LTFQLLKGGAKVWEWENVTNTGSNKFSFPTSLRPSKDYIIDVLDKNGVQFRSQTFSICRKIPTALKFAPFVIAGIVVLILPKGNIKTINDPLAPHLACLPPFSL
jgi:hypothetical protein